MTLRLLHAGPQHLELAPLWAWMFEEGSSWGSRQWLHSPHHQSFSPLILQRLRFLPHSSRKASLVCKTFSYVCLLNSTFTKQPKYSAVITRTTVCSAANNFTKYQTKNITFDLYFVFYIHFDKFIKQYFILHMVETLQSWVITTCYFLFSYSR